MPRLVVALIALLAFAAVAVAYPPATITDVTRDSVTIQGLECGTQYRIRIEERNAANTDWTSLTTHTPTTAACPTPPPPTANFAVSPDPAVRTQPTVFTSTGTCAATPCTYRWFLGDASSTSPADEIEPGAAQPNAEAQFTFTNGGQPAQAGATRTVTLRVTDGQGREVTATKTFGLVEQSSPPPPPPTRCANGLDDDGDSKIDLTDPGCSGPDDDDESNVIPPPTGCGSSTGTVQPGQSWDAAYDSASPGAVLSVAAGNHGGQSITGTKAGTVTFCAQATATVNLNIRADNVRAVGPFQSSGLVVGHPQTPDLTENVHVEDVRVACAGCRNPVYSSRNRNVTLEDVEVTGAHNPSDVVLLDGGIPGGVTDFTIDGMWMHDNTHNDGGAAHSDGIAAWGVNGFVLRNSRFHNNAINNLSIDGWGGTPNIARDYLIENNSFAPAWHSGHTSPRLAIHAAWGDNIVLRNNTIGSGITLYADQRRLTNSKFVGNLMFQNSICPPGITFSKNVIVSGGVNCGGTNKMVLSPGVVDSDPRNPDYHLVTGSPAIDAADPADFPAEDYDGQPRTGTPDAGMDER
jgi:hypothetical protein